VRGGDPFEGAIDNATERVCKALVDVVAPVEDHSHSREKPLGVAKSDDGLLKIFIFGRLFHLFLSFVTRVSACDKIVVSQAEQTNLCSVSLVRGGRETGRSGRLAASCGGDLRHAIEVVLP
jgi:hypothetical protein